MSREQQNKAKDLIQEGQWQQAIDALNEAQPEEGENAWVIGSLAFCHSRLKHYKEAIELYERLCMMQPTVARWPYSLGYQYYDQQDWTRAIEYFDRALKIEPEYIVVLYRRGYALSRIDGREGEALTTLEHCRQSYLALPDGVEKGKDSKTYADACYQQGKLFLDGGKASLALERLREAATLSPGEADVHYSLGKAYLALSRWDDAMVSLKTALRLSPLPQHYVLDAIAQAHAGAGQLDEAIKAYEQMDASVRGRPYILRNMGTIYASLEQYDRAEQTFQEAVRKEPGNHNGHYRLGRVYEQLQKWAEAGGEYKTAIDLRQRNYGLPFPDAEKHLAGLISEHPEVREAPRPRPPAPAHQDLLASPAQQERLAATALPVAEERSAYVPRQAAPVRPAQTSPAAPQRPSAYPTHQGVPVRPAQTSPAAPQQGAAYPTRQGAPVRPAQTSPSAPKKGSAYPTRQGAPVRPAQTSSAPPQRPSAYPTRQGAPVRPAQTSPSAPQKGSAYPTRQGAPIRPAQTWRRDAQPRQSPPRATTSARAVGRVKSFFADKGFGFIEVGGGQPDLFFHMSEVQGRPVVQAGDQMEYSIGQGPRGPIAVELKVVGTQKQEE